MTTQPDSGCSNLIIQPYPIDTLANIANVMAFFKEMYEPDNADLSMSRESRLGFYILMSMVQQAAEFEVMRLSESTDATSALFSHEPMPEDSREALSELFDQLFAKTEEDVAH